MSAKLISFHNGFLGCHDESARERAEEREALEEADGEGKRGSHRMSAENDFKT